LKVLLVTIGSSGDVHPFVGLGLALSRRGHEVTLVTGGYFRELAEQAGLDFADPLPEFDFRAMLGNADIWHRFRGLQVIMRSAILPLIRPVYRLIAERYEPGRTLIVASSLAFGARIAQQRLAIPTATVHLQPSIFRSMHATTRLPGMLLDSWVPAPLKRLQYWLMDRLMTDRITAPAVNEVRAEVGLAPVRGIMNDWWHSPELVLGLFADWFAPPQPDWPPQTVLTGFPLYDERGIVEPSQELEDFLGAGEPPIVFTPGSANVHGREFFQAAIEACGRLRRRGILLTRFPEQLPQPLPAGIRHESFVPFGWLLPRSAAVVHHGGIGSLSQGLAAGIPQLMMPMGFDQFDNAHRLEQLGLGAAIRPSRFRGPAVAHSLERLLADPLMADRCRAIRERLASHDGLLTAAKCLERFATTAGLPVTEDRHGAPAGG
jgi:UDP:flavonoid glycosyltransferase YjiC (YdhE family)